MAPKNQVHDFHPPIAESGLYWVVPVPAGGLTYADGGRAATLAMRDVAVIDQPRWPALDALGAPATLSFRLVFKATDRRVTYEDPYKQFKFTGWQATARLEAQVHVPGSGFSWKSDPLETSRCDFAILGEEANGRYYPAIAPATVP